MNAAVFRRPCALALSLGASLLMPAVAQAQSSVQVYGLVDMGLGYYKGGGYRQTLLASGQDAPSRLGFKGREDLGAGMAAIFKLEAGVSADTGSGAGGGGIAFNRESWVGLSGGFGELVAGRVWSVTDDAWSVHRFSNFSAFIFAEFGNFDRTYGNAIKYTTPTLSGFQGSAVYSFGEAQNSTRPGSAAELGLNYQSGPVKVFLSHSETRNLLSTRSDKLTVLAGSYAIGPVLVRAAYYDSRPQASGLTPTKAALLGADYAFAKNWSVGADYLRRSVSGSDKGSGVARLLLNHELSPRTGVYAYLARLNNRGGDTQSFRGAVTADASQTGLNVGVRHRF